MDAAWFLKDRTRFIRYYYDECVKPFQETLKRIEGELPPFDNPSYDESGEPPFLSEWMEARTAIGITGLACISLLSDSLKLYLQALQERVIGFAFNETKGLWKPGFLSVYKSALGEILNTDWADCPVDFDVIEQVVLARNRAQHGSHLTSLRVAHDEATLKKHPRPFFISDDELRSLEQEDGSLSVFLSPDITISRDNLFAAIAEIDKLADWIDGRGDQIYEWRMKRR